MILHESDSDSFVKLCGCQEVNTDSNFKCSSQLNLLYDLRRLMNHFYICTYDAFALFLKLKKGINSHLLPQHGKELPKHLTKCFTSLSFTEERRSYEFGKT